jgi:triphosphatase
VAGIREARCFSRIREPFPVAGILTVNAMERPLNIEPELKFRVAKRRLASLAGTRVTGARLGPRADRKLVSTYFDTGKRKLRRHGLSLRVRQAGDEYVQTVKTAAAGGFARGEWETDVGAGTPDFHKIGDTPLAPVAGKKTRRKIEPVFRTTVHRVTRPLRLGRSVIELAVDRGRLSAGRRSRPIAEFELELKKGRTADLFRIARTFERTTGAELDLRSKAERGYRLADGDNQGAVHAEPIRLASKLTAGEAFHVIAFSALRHFAANADAVREGQAEAIHQMRVGLRRLRAAISLFGDVLPGSGMATIKAELKWLTNELAPAREIDVFVQERIRPLRHAAGPQRGARAIEKQFSARRRQAFQRARRALEAPRYRSLLIDVLEWLELRTSTAGEKAKTPIGTFAAKLLDRRVRKSRKQGRHLDELTAHGRHKLRIKLKKLRYAVGFFESLYPKKAHDELETLSKRLKKLQDALGALNDFVAHQEIASDAALHAPRKDRRARAFASGLLVGQEREASRTLLKAAEKEIRQLRPLEVMPG